MRTRFGKVASYLSSKLGVAVILLTNLLLVPVVLSYVRYDDQYLSKLKKRASRMRSFWIRLSYLATKRVASISIAIAVLILIPGIWKAPGVRIGDLHRGVPELHADSRYNIDSDVISSRFTIGVDVLSVIVETIPEGCINHDVMQTMDDFSWAIQNVPGVQSVVCITSLVLPG